MMEREVENEIVNFCGDVSVPDERKKKTCINLPILTPYFFYRGTSLVVSCLRSWQESRISLGLDDYGKGVASCRYSLKAVE